MISRTLLAAVAVAATAPVASAASVPTHRSTFKVELKGKQTTNWSYTHTANGECDADQFGDGKETVRFHGHTKVVAYEGMSPLLLLSTRNKPASMTLHGTVTRDGDLTTGAPMAAEYCPDGVGGGDPPTDCGTRTISGLKVAPSYLSGTQRIRLDQVDSGPGVDYLNCFVSGVSYPFLLDRSGGRPVGQKLPYADLFEHGKHILIATGVDRVDDGETKSETRIRWVLSLTRVKVEEL